MKRAIFFLLILTGCSNFRPLERPAPPALSSEYPHGPEREVAGVANAFSCFAATSAEERSVIVLAGKVVSNSKVEAFSLKSEILGMNVTDRVLKASPSAPPRELPRYKRFPAGAHPFGPSFRDLEVLLPAELTRVTGRFDAFVADPTTALADRPTYERVSCRMF